MHSTTHTLFFSGEPPHQGAYSILNPTNKPVAPYGTTM